MELVGSHFFFLQEQIKDIIISSRDLTRPNTLTDTRPRCFEVEKHALRQSCKRALPSDKSGALPPENGFPLHNVRVRGQADSSGKHNAFSTLPSGH
jgi:hypothetical protein